MKIDMTALENEDLVFEKFAKKIQTIYKKQCKQEIPSGKFAKEFVQLLNMVCPELAKRFPKLVAVMLEFEVIDFAIKGLNDPILTALWKNQEPEGYTPYTIQKYSQSFGIRIASHLWKKNAELENIDLKPKANPLTLEEYLRQKFNLSQSEIKVLVAFCQSENRGRRQIAKDLVLTENTIKTHSRNILRKMKVKTINEAVDISSEFVP
jgi:DNA-binding CsgD family transcriptional regulator